MEAYARYVGEDEMNEWLDNRSKVVKAINSAILESVKAHGPISKENVGSASKRIYAILKDIRRGAKTKEQTNG